jgi:hypothetical protein
LISSPKRLASVNVVGMHMIVPPKSEGPEPTRVPLNSGSDGKTIAISKITADGAVLEFVREDPAAKNYILKVDKLVVTDVGPGTRMSYRLTLTNTEPPGVIRAEGKFGPWDPSDVGVTQVSGNYTYDDIDFSIFASIAGKGHARGQFSGQLSQIQTRGSVDVTGFRVDPSDHAIQLATTFDASVDGTKGDVELHPAVVRYRATQVEVRGSIAGRGGTGGKTVSLQIAVPKGRVDDLLYLFEKGEPGMSGDVTTTGSFLWPPGPRNFLEKIELDLDFAMKESRFTSPTTAQSINRISESAQGEKRKQLGADPTTVLSLVNGKIHLRGGTAAIAHGSFSVPGADAQIQGTYSLLNKRVNLRGTLDTKGNLADATSGFKAVVLTLATPLFRKQKSMWVIPFDITGSYGNTALGIDWKRDLLRKGN